MRVGVDDLARPGWPGPRRRARPRWRSPRPAGSAAPPRARPRSRRARRPAPASRARPAAAITAPALISSPARRTPCPRLGCSRISTAAMPWSVKAGGTTTSAAAGSGAPAATEKQVPGASRTGRQLDALRSPTTLSRTGRCAAAPSDVLGPGGVAVDRGVVEGGQRAGRAHLLGQHVAVGLGEVQVERRQRAQSLQDTSEDNRRAVSARGWGPAWSVRSSPQSAVGLSAVSSSSWST